MRHMVLFNAKIVTIITTLLSCDLFITFNVWVPAAAREGFEQLQWHDSAETLLIKRLVSGTLAPSGHSLSHGYEGTPGTGGPC